MSKVTQQVKKGGFMFNTLHTTFSNSYLSSCIFQIFNFQSEAPSILRAMGAMQIWVKGRVDQAPLMTVVVNLTLGVSPVPRSDPCDLGLVVLGGALSQVQSPQPHH